MSKIWILGDVHLGYKNDNEEIAEKMVEYLSTVINKINEESSDGDIFIQLGDFFDRRITVGTNIITKTIELLSKIKIETYILVGNHDTVKNDDHTIISTAFLDLISPKIHIICDMTKMVLHGKKILFMPYYTPATAKDKLECLNESFDYMFSHLDFDGLKMNKYTVSETCLKNTGLDIRLIFNGHIHLSQKRGNIINVGAAYELTAADEGNDKYLLSVNTENDKISIFKNEVYPQYKRIKYAEIDSISDDIIKNNFVIVEVNNSDVMNVNNDKLTELRKKAFSVNAVIVDDKKAVIKNNDSSSVKQKSFYEKIDDYISSIVEQELYDSDTAQKASKILKDTFSSIES